MSHSDSIKAPTNGKLASTHDVEFAAYKMREKPLMPFNTIQVFIQLTVQNVRKLLVKIAEFLKTLPTAFVEEMVAELRVDDKVVLGLSGGVDSTVAAVLLHQALVKISIVFL
jgi:GMP synthase (glutamine-hydrolysing)